MNTAEYFIILQKHVHQHNKKKNLTIGLSKPAKLKKFPLFSEHTSYVFANFIALDYRGTTGWLFRKNYFNYSHVVLFQ